MVGFPWPGDERSQKFRTIAAMQAPTRILIACDLSPASDEAIRQGHEWAVKWNARFAVCHIVPNILRGNPLFPQLDAGNALAVSDLRDRATKMLVDRVTSLTGRSADDIEVILDEGTPHAAILQSAERWKADLVVVGSQGSTGLARILLGSVADRIVRHAATSVLVARSSPSGGPILVCTDFSVPTMPAVAAAVKQSQDPARGLTLLHVIDVPTHASTLSYLSVPFGGVVYGGLDAATQGAIEKAADERLRDVATKFGASQAEVSVAWGKPAAVILRTAERLGAGLVVVGTVGHTGFDRVLLGSVAEAVVRAAHCSVLVVRLTPPEPPDATP